MAYAFADGLVAASWRCEITTASSKTPSSLDNYDLLVLCTPTYYNEPANSIRDYLQSLGPIADQSIALMVTAGTSPEWAMRHMETAVAEAGGEIVLRLELLQTAPNETERGIEEPEVIARNAGLRIQLP